VLSSPACNRVSGNQSLAGEPLYGCRVKFKKITGLRSGYEYFCAAKGFGGKHALRLTDL
jgi:hypothetical protein